MPTGDHCQTVCPAAIIIATTRIRLSAEPSLEPAQPSCYASPNAFIVSALLIKPGDILCQPGHRGPTRGELSTTVKLITKEIEASFYLVDEGLVRVLRNPQFLQRPVHDADRFAQLPAAGGGDDPVVHETDIQEIRESNGPSVSPRTMARALSTRASQAPQLSICSPSSLCTRSTGEKRYRPTRSHGHWSSALRSPQQRRRVHTSLFADRSCRCWHSQWNASSMTTSEASCSVRD